MTAKTGSAPASPNSFAQLWLHFKNKLLCWRPPHQHQQLPVPRNLLLCHSLTHTLDRRHSSDQSAAGETIQAADFDKAFDFDRPSDSIICMCEQRCLLARPLEKPLWVLSLQPLRLLARRPAWFSGSRLLSLTDSRDMTHRGRSLDAKWRVEALQGNSSCISRF